MEWWRLYDVTNQQVRFYKSGYAQFGIYLQPSFSEIMTTILKIYASGKIFTFYDTGKLRFPTLSSAPSSPAAGDVAVCNLGILHDYYSGTWVRLTGEAGW